MTFFVGDPVVQTILFGLVLLTVGVCFWRRREGAMHLSPEVTLELKGLAILAVVFAHVGYYLSQDARFLFPFSTAGGVGVDMFLCLSGYGLTHSLLRKSPSLWAFYEKRLSRVYFPLWIVLAVLFVTDRLALGISYSTSIVVQSFFGWFPQADLYINVDSPLWYLTFLIFFYLALPLLFVRRAPWVSAVALALLGYFVTHTTHITIPVTPSLLAMYRTHTYAFPLGVLLASLPWRKLEAVGQKLASLFWVRVVGALALAMVAVYAIGHSQVGHGPWREQAVSLLTVLVIMAVFVVKPWRSGLLLALGTFSYEIYLLHWPLFYHFDPFFGVLPAALAFTLSLVICFALARGLSHLTGRIYRITRA